MRLFVFLTALLLPVSLLARERVTDDDVARNLEQLRSSKFEEREDGTRGLFAAGERGVAAAKQAATDDDLEVCVRGIRVLVSIAASEVQAAAAAAEAALGELAIAKRAPLARLAQDGLQGVKEIRGERQQKLIAALRKLGGVPLLNERGDVYRIDFEGEYITDEGLEAQRLAGLKEKPGEGRIVEKEEFSKYIVRTHVEDDDLAILKKFPSLTYLSMHRTEVSSAGLVHLKSLTKLEYLVLNQQISDEGLAHLAELVELKSLSFPQSQVTGAGFEHLLGLARLEEIDLTNSRADDAGVQVISEFANLRTLKLGNTRVTDAGAVHLSRLRKLNLLTLHGTSVSDRGLEAVSNLEDLRSLMLDSTRISDQGIVHLAKLKRLEAVSFTEPLVTKAGAENLRREMPKTNVYLWPKVAR